MNRRDFMRICVVIIIFVWLAIATVPYRLALIQNATGHYYDEKMSSQEYLIRKAQAELAKVKTAPLETKLDCDEALAKVVWGSSRAGLAVDILHEVNKQREKVNRNYNQKSINTMLLLAGAYRDIDRMEESNALYEQIWQLDKENLLPGDACLTRDQINLAMMDYLRGDSADDKEKQKAYFKNCLEHIQRAQAMWHQEKHPDVAKLANLFYLKYLACRSLGDELSSKQAYGEMKFLNKKIPHICYPPLT